MTVEDLTTHETAADACPWCGKVQDRASNADGKAGAPEEGDVSVCIRCAGACVFDAKLKLRKATGGELAELRANPAFRKAQWAVRQLER
ncbi:MAG: hypothetical protein OXC08_20690 [Thiotrichales bacterium]|nr:hypothetical protein [Thiotrichales bacterium]